VAEGGLRLAAESGVHLMDGLLSAMGAYASFLEGDRKKTAWFIAHKGRGTAPSGPLEHGHYHYLLAWQAILGGRAPLAAEHARVAVRLAATTGAPFAEANFSVAAAEAAAEVGEWDEAGAHLRRAQELNARVRSSFFEFRLRLTEAHLAFARGDARTGLAHLSQALSLGRRNGFTAAPWWRPDVMADLCAAALDANLEPEYVRGLIVRRRLMPAKPPVDVDGWPWRFRLYTWGVSSSSSMELRSDSQGGASRSPWSSSASWPRSAAGPSESAAPPRPCGRMPTATRPTVRSR